MKEPPGRGGSITDAFLANRSRIGSFLSRLLSNRHDIEDVLQETYLRALGAERDRKITSPKAFLYRVARNEALRELERASRRIVELVGTPDEMHEPLTGQSLEREALVTEQFGSFCESTLEMPPQCRRVFLMCKVYGFSYPEIASELDISVSAVEKHVSKGLKIAHLHLRRLEGGGQEDGSHEAALNRVDK